MTQENIILLINTFASIPVQGILWFIVFWGARTAINVSSDRIVWLESRLDKYMDRDMEVVVSVATAGKYSERPKLP